MKQLFKNYKRWMSTKAFINNQGIKRSFKEGDVWWAAVGENVGFEIDGKSNKYSRPVVVLKKHSGLFFTAVPLTSQKHEGSWYRSFVFQEKNQTAVLVQSKPMDVTRLYNKIGELSKSDYNKIMESFLALYK